MPYVAEADNHVYNFNTWQSVGYESGAITGLFASSDSDSVLYVASNTKLYRNNELNAVFDKLITDLMENTGDIYVGSTNGVIYYSPIN